MTADLLPIAAQAAGAIPIAVAAFLLGRAVLPQGGFATTLESAALRVSVGLVALALLGFALGLFAWLTPGPALTALVALSLLALWRGRDIPAAMSSREAFGSHAAFLGAALALFGAGAARLALYPAADWDAVSYHLPVARDFIEHGLLVASTYLRFPVFPQAADVLFAWGLLLGGETAAQLVSLLAWLLTTALLFLWGARDDTPRAGLWAAALWMGGQTALQLGFVAYVDGILTLFTTAAAYALWRWRSAPAASRATLFWLAAVLAGAAAATKYTGLWMALLLAAGVARWERPGARTRSTLLFLLGTLAVASPWYVRSALLSGDPFFPLLGKWLGSSYWSAEDVARHEIDVHSHGLGRDLGSFLGIWWDLAFQQSRFHAERLVSLTLVLPLPLLAFLRRRSARGRAIAAFAFACFVPWFFAGQQLRYLLPVIALLCLEVATLLDGLARRVRLPERSWLGAGAAAAVTLLLSWSGVRHLIEIGARRGPLPLEPAERSRYLSDRLPGHEAVAFLNASRGHDYGLYALYGTRLAWACEGRFFGEWFGPGRYTEVTDRMGSAEDLAAWLRDLGATHLLLVRPLPESSLPARDGTELPPDADFAARFTPILVRDDFTLYEIGAAP